MISRKHLIFNLCKRWWHLRQKAFLRALRLRTEGWNADRALKTLQTDDVQDGAKEDAACAALDRKITVYVILRGQKPLVKICGTNTVL
jgi:hypothetical protein